MPIIDPRRSILVVVDFQARLMPAIHDAATAIANARRLLDAAAMLDIPVVFTEQNPTGLGPTVPELVVPGRPVVPKMTFDAVRAPGFLDRVPGDRAAVVTGCEAHVCVGQTVLGLLATGRAVHVVRDAVGSRRPESKETALARMARHGAEIVTTEMVVFEWLETAEHPRFREVARLIR
ncbi:isochorismatase family protein [Rhodoplanes serenus]|uniref:Isochorismatase family protein n=1 Tax=Rhodoplanes serenus TaxID=200615 RepID=A0A447CWX3_9BRAD|nr:isochorismatase family protein [Rhodoplanes serenus]MBI5112569.1 isochorismatase family protein [Rhodovulum sp.]MTW17945.1 isochorismatase family protein [Rhodoplanes serenus]VCU09776.1 hypothetical protein RHODGE_RHODGE_02946 [Rhodoplanes serenus]